jgi:hypothetical protein
MHLNKLITHESVSAYFQCDPGPLSILKSGVKTACLITFNPDKTDIRLFDSRRQGSLNLKFGQTDILSVDFHKHMGIVFSTTSSDGKWTRHIDYILSKASK